MINPQFNTCFATTVSGAQNKEQVQDVPEFARQIAPRRV